MSKYIWICGGVCSTVGKGVTAASLALLLKMRGEKVQYLKLEAYWNIDSSLLSPEQHGEVWLGEGGNGNGESCECDLDLGHVYRITGIDVNASNIFTSGKLYQEIVTRERNGYYIGKTLQIVPHFTDLIQEKIENISKDTDILIVEIGGTAGDNENSAFFQALSQFKQKHYRDVLIVHVAPVIWFNNIGEFKTKPLQNSVIELKRFGLIPDIILCRCDKIIPDKVIEKVSNMTNVPINSVFPVPDVQTVYQVPISFYDRHIDDLIADKFNLKRNGVRIHKWRDLVEKYVNSDLPEVNVGIVGKYVSMADAYLSLKEAIYHAGVGNNYRVNIQWIEAEKLEEYSTLRGLQKFFENIDGVIVPGGFDNRGVEGKIRAIQYVREKKIPFLGICLGLQCAVIEFARNVCDITNANSVEFANSDEEITPVIHYVEGQENIKQMGGTLRLGSYDCQISKGSIAHQVYEKRLIKERHRHRYEVNSEYTDIYAKNGFMVSGVNPQSNLIEIMELSRDIHPFAIGCQFHPEYKSRLDNPHPLFFNLITQAIQFKNKSAKEQVEVVTS